MLQVMMVSSRATEVRCRCLVYAASLYIQIRGNGARDLKTHCALGSVAVSNQIDV